MFLTSTALYFAAPVGLYLSCQLSVSVQLADRLPWECCHVNRMPKDDKRNNGRNNDLSSSNVPQMKCMSCCQSCQRVLPTLVPNVLNAIPQSGGQHWRGSFRAAFAMSLLHCSTRAHPHTCCATDRLDAHAVASSRAILVHIALLLCQC